MDGSVAPGSPSSTCSPNSDIARWVIPARPIGLDLIPPIIEWNTELTATFSVRGEEKNIFPAEVLTLESSESFSRNLPKARQVCIPAGKGQAKLISFTVAEKQNTIITSFIIACAYRDALQCLMIACWSCYMSLYSDLTITSIYQRLPV